MRNNNGQEIGRNVTLRPAVAGTAQGNHGIDQEIQSENVQEEGCEKGRQDQKTQAHGQTDGPRRFFEALESQKSRREQILEIKSALAAFPATEESQRTQIIQEEPQSRQENVVKEKGRQQTGCEEKEETDRPATCPCCLLEAIEKVGQSREEIRNNGLFAARETGKERNFQEIHNEKNCQEECGLQAGQAVVGFLSFASR